MSRRTILAVVIAATMSSTQPASRGQAEPAPGAAPITVALLTFGPEHRTARCFSENFLDLIRRETSITVARPFASVALDSDELFAHPFVIFSGEGAFELSASETMHLAQYIRRGGFVLASAGCSNHAWAVSFERAMKLAMPDAPLRELPPEHPLFQTVFKLDDLTSRRGTPCKIMGVELDGRLCVLYSPQGLNDTRNVDTATPGECCCCGGDEIVGAKYLNAAALVYALMP
jgi:hypothetical protein